MARVKALADIAENFKAKIYSFNNLSPVSRVAVYIKAGSRYEPNEVPGIAHYLSAAAKLTTERSSLFGIVRHIEKAGANFNVTADREYIVYKVECLRDKLDFCLDFVEDTLHKQEFRSWELVDEVQPKLKQALGSFKSNQRLVANEAMHKAAFRGGLAHSKFVPEHQIEKIQNHQLFDYVKAHYIPSRMAFIGYGLEREDLIQLVDEKFRFSRASDYGGVDGKTRYVGGEARIQAGFPNTLVNYVVQGAPIIDLKSVAALEVIAALLGGYQQQYIKYGCGPAKSLSHLMHTKFSPSIKTSMINITYTDTGLFGFSLTGPNEVLHSAVKNSAAHVKHVLSNLSEADFKLGKIAAKARSLMMSENSEASYQAMAHRCAAGISNVDPLAVLESLSFNDVQTAAKNLLTGKATIVSVGNPRHVPYLDDLEH